jgi:ABC-type uncharacterized transport system ATPase subunit
MVTHHLSHLLAICQRLIIMDRGQVALDTDTNNLLKNYGSLKALGIELPLHLQVVYHLQERGWKIDTSDLSMPEIARQITRARQQQSGSKANV